MMKNTAHRRWLEIAEYVSVAGSVVGSAIAIATQQLVYAATPLTLGLALNLANRRLQSQALTERARAMYGEVSSRLSEDQQKLGSEIQSLRQEFAALPTPPEPVNLIPIHQELEQLKSDYVAIHQTLGSFSPNTRVDSLDRSLTALTQQVTQLPPPFDPSWLLQNLEDLRVTITQTEQLAQEKASKQELQQQLEDLRVTINQTEQLAHEKVSKQELQQRDEEIQRLNAAQQSLSEQFNHRSEPMEIERLTHLTQALSERLDHLPVPPPEFNPAPLLQQLEDLRAAIAQIEQATTAGATKQELEQLTQELQELYEREQSLDEQFQSRPEPQEINILREEARSLSKRLDTFPAPPPAFDPAPLLQEFEQLRAAIAQVEQATTERATQRELAQLHGAIAQIEQALMEGASKQELEGIKAEVRQLQAQEQSFVEQFSDYFEPQELERLTHLTNSLSERLDAVTTTSGFNLTPLRNELQAGLGDLQQEFSEEIQRLREQLETVPAASGDFNPTPLRNELQAGLRDLQQEFSEEIQRLREQLETVPAASGDFNPTPLRNELRAGLRDLQQEFSEEIQRLRERLETLPLPSELADLREIREAIAQQQDDFTLPRESGSLELVQQQLAELSGLAAKLDQRTLQLRDRFKHIGGMQQEFESWRSRIKNILTPEDLEAALQEQRRELLAQISELQDRFIAPGETTDNSEQLQELEARIEELDATLRHRTSQLQARIRELTAMQEEFEQVRAAASDSAPETLEAALQEQRREVMAQLEQEFAAMQEQLDELHASANNSSTSETLEAALQEQRREVMAQLEQEFAAMQEQLDELHASASNSSTSETLEAAMQEQRREVMSQLEQQLAATQAQLDELNKLATISSNREVLEMALQQQRLELMGEVESSVEQRVNELNQLLTETRPDYKYDLLFDRASGRRWLLTAASNAKTRLILISPWLTWGIDWNDYELLDYLEALLEDPNVLIDIGWGSRQDVEIALRRFKTGSLRDRLRANKRYRNLEYLEELEEDYPDQFRLKILGTQENYIVCDRTFAVIGTHHFLSTGDQASVRELGLRTTDPRLIDELIQRFDNSQDLEDLIEQEY
jgi:DNA repair exonuclease SbcCD ATPase subunit